VTENTGAIEIVLIW